MKLSLAKCWCLLIFDMIGLAISGYAFLLVFQILEILPSSNIFIILMGIFIAIKVVTMSLYNLNRKLLLKNIPFIAAFISIVGNIIIFGVGFIGFQEIPLNFFIGLTISDFVMVLICHFLWWVLIGKDDNPQNSKAKETKDKKIKGKSEKKRGKVKKDNKTEKEKSWLEEDEESEYDSIFNTLLENEKKRDRGMINEPIPEMFEEEKRYQTGEFLKDIKRTLIEETKENKVESKMTPGNLAPQQTGKIGTIQKEQGAGTRVIPVQRSIKQVRKPETDVSKIVKETKEERPSLGNFDISPIDKVSSVPISKEMPLSEVKVVLPKIKTPEISKPSQSLGGVSPKVIISDIESKEERKEKTTMEKIPKEVKPSIPSPKTIEIENDNDFLAIEKRLGYLFHEIEKSMGETQKLQESISEFHEEVGTYTPITGDEKIIATGNLIREKLKAIIDKQFIVDEVLDDLIRLSKLINNRIDDLDVIESGLNKRKKVLDQRESFKTENYRKAVDADVEIMSEEVIIENVDSEFIIAEEDYETIRKYLMKNPNR